MKVARAKFIQNPEGCINNDLRAGRDCSVCYFSQVEDGMFVGTQACYDAQCLIYNYYNDEPETDTQAKEYGDIWSVIECLYHVLGEFAKDFDVYAIAQELIFFKNGRLYANLQRDDFWDIVSRHDLSGVLENSDEREA